MGAPSGGDEARAPQVHVAGTPGRAGTTGRARRTDGRAALWSRTMNNSDLLDRYSKSWFDDFLPAERIITPGPGHARTRRQRPSFARALMENVEEARDAVEGTRSRLTRARQD